VKACQEVESHRTCCCCPQHLSDSAWHHRHHHPASSPKKMGEKKTERSSIRCQQDTKKTISTDGTNPHNCY